MDWKNESEKYELFAEEALEDDMEIGESLDDLPL